MIFERDILVYSSHGENKRSFHIVVRGYCHVNNVEASSLYSLIMKQFPDDLKRYAATIDRSVYSSKQQFRMLGSQKRQSNRPKIFQTIWTYFGNQIQHIYTMKPTSAEMEELLRMDESIISNTASCIILPSFVDGVPQVQIQHQDDLSVELATQAMNLAKKERNYKVQRDNGLFNYDKFEEASSSYNERDHLLARFVRVKTTFNWRMAR